MAITDQARFYDPRGLSSTELGNALLEWFRQQDFETRSFTDVTGRYVVQVRKASTARSILGLNYALTVSLTSQPDSKLLIELGGADWTDKIISGAVGVLLIYPLIFTAAYGAWQQSDLSNRVWDFLSGYIYNRTGQPVTGFPAVPYYNNTPGFNPNSDPASDRYYPSTNYAPSGMSGFPPAPKYAPPANYPPPASASTEATQSWFDMTTMQPIFDQQIGRMASWQQAMADGKIVTEEV